MRNKGKYSRPRQKSHGWIWVVMVLALLCVCTGLTMKVLPEFLPEHGDTQPPLDAEETAAPTEPAGTEAAETEATIPQTEPPEAPALEAARKILEDMTLEEKIYQLFIVTQEQITGVGTVIQSGDASRTAIETHPVGGIIYFAANVISREQTAEMIRNIQSYSKLGLFIAVDEEGGSVARIGSNSAMGTTAFPAMGTIGASGQQEQAYHVGRTIGSEILELGFNLDFAPVADVFSNPSNTVIGNRAFSSDPQTAADMVAACAEGFSDSGMLCTLKHFPGHGDTGADSHYGAVEITKTLEELKECEFLPFQAGIDAGAPFVMVGHITAPNVTEVDLPATLSHEIVTGLLKDMLGFEGLVITDSMAMQAITDNYTSGEAAVMALQAGVDIILMPQNLTDAVSSISGAVASGELTEARIDESVLKILETKIEAGIIPIS